MAVHGAEIIMIGDMTEAGMTTESTTADPTEGEEVEVEDGVEDKTETSFLGGGLLHHTIAVVATDLAPDHDHTLHVAIETWFMITSMMCFGKLYKLVGFLCSLEDIMHVFL